jgi:hypothetical protein
MLQENIENVNDVSDTVTEHNIANEEARANLHIQMIANKESITNIQNVEIVNIWNAINLLKQNKPVPIPSSEPGQPGIDLDALSEMFACKQAPDRTIFRIEDLEN